MISRLILGFLPFALPLYVIRFRMGPLPTTLLEISLIVLLLAWTLTRRQNGWKNAGQNLSVRGWLWPLIAWLLAGSIGVAVASDHLAALGLWRAYFLEPTLLFWMLADLIRDDSDKRILLRSLIITVGALTIWAVFQTVTGYGIPSPWHAPPAGIRATGPFPYPNALALFVVPLAALFAALALHRPALLNPRLAWLGWFAGGLATFLAKSDGGLIALGSSLVVTLVLIKKIRWPIVALSLFSLTLIFSFPSTRKLATDQLFFREWSGKVRLVMWKETRAMLKEHPVLGVGLGNYRKGIMPYHTATWMEIFQYPHNILLNLWSEIGLLGLVVFSWIGWRWWRQSGLIALPVMTALLIHGFVDVPYFKNDLALLFWMLIALTQKTEFAPTRSHSPRQGDAASELTPGLN